MSYLVLARKYRPSGFDAFVGQDVIAETLRNSIRLDRVAHAYLFCGPRGVGKTSMARVFAKALNCKKGPTLEPCEKCESCKAIAGGQDVDVIEIDGASNRGIDQVREIRQNARYSASHSRFKIYYIDEVHMLTEAAFNALLKTLEEPPPHVKFIFATTAAAKLPETILSRVQRFDFRRISNSDIIAKLAEICKAEKIKASPEVMLLVARRARGSMRDALSLFDQILSFCGEEPQLDAVSRLLGALGDEHMGRILQKASSRDAAGLLQEAGQLLARGMDVGEIIDQMVSYLRDLLVAKLCGADTDLLDRPPESAVAIVEAAKSLEPERILYMAQVLNEVRRRVREGQDDRIVLEMAFVKLTQAEDLKPLGEILERLVAMEEIIESQGTRPGESTYVRSSGENLTPRSPAQHSTAEATVVPEESDPDPKPNPTAMDKSSDLWKQLLEGVHRRKSWIHVNLAVAILQRVENNEVTIAFPPDRGSQRKEVEKPEARQLIQSALEELLGRSIRVHFVTAGEQSSTRTPQETAAQDEVVQQILRVFDGQIVSS